jgi:murein DD-endopeptidase MepM/ murein hydrolase activator NlpD
MTNNTEVNQSPLDIDILRSQADSPLWEIEPSTLSYSYPLPIDKAIIDSGEILAHDVSTEELKHIGPFISLPSPDSHIGPFKSAIDFAVKDGTPVLAAQDGKVIAIVDSNAAWGPGPEFANTLNYITLQHNNGEFSEYAHLAQSSVDQNNLKVGDRVIKGQKIATVGKTGWTDRDHLHFLVFRLDQGTQELPNSTGFKSLLPSFEE